jgi:hypothetical protein
MKATEKLAAIGACALVCSTLLPASASGEGTKIGFAADAVGAERVRYAA